METSILRFVEIELVGMLGMEDSHSSYGTCISREKVPLQMVGAKVLFGSR